jgi:endonuclease/exonuclease/phosphatase family metal-dependent hydrolase
MWYNVENLFHPGDDPSPGDDEFTPSGVRNWTFTRYHEKITRLAKVIIAAGGWDPPDVVGLGEVENALVLEDLVSHPILEPYHYRYLHRDSPDHRGMDLACLYREDRFKPYGWSAIPVIASGSLGSTREMIHLWGPAARKDTMDLFLVHFISRYGGSGATAEYRRKQAMLLVSLCDSVRRVRPDGPMVLAGDFNEEWEGYSLEPIRNARAGKDPIRVVPPEGPQGSYKYRGVWSHIDHFLVAGGNGPYRFSSSVVSLPFLLTPDEAYGGMKPSRTYDGYRYTGGFSDHLPILLKISRPLFSKDSSPLAPLPFLSQASSGTPPGIHWGSPRRVSHP